MKYGFFSFFFLLFAACTSSVETKLEWTLSLAAENKAELEKVLAYYEKDSLKYEAARFLIENMVGKGTLAYEFYKDGKQLCRLDTCRFADGKEWEAFLTSGVFRKLPEVPDLQKITASFLIENIELAFEVRNRYPWCKRLSFERFCREVLPYRIKNEEPGDWRRYYYTRYRAAADSLAAAGLDLEQVVYALNRIAGKKYLHEAGFISGDFPYTFIEYLGGGTCDHLALNAVQMMRALGIPLYLDLVPYHGKINGGHTYNSFRTEQGKLVFFSPYEREPERKRWLAPLVLRVDYEVRDNPFAGAVFPYNQVLASRTLRNVTAEYFDVQDVTLSSLSVRDSIVYLATYNRADFKAVAQAQVRSGKASFQHLTCGLLYFPVVPRRNFFYPASDPFLIRENGEIVPIRPKPLPTTLNRVPVRDVNRIVEPGADRYRLYYWDRGWRRIADTVSTGSGFLDFGTVPYRSLFLIQGVDLVGRLQRPFLWEKGEYIFY